MKKDNPLTDHDLLIRLDAKVDNLSTDVKLMGDGLSGRVSNLETWREGIDIYHAKIPLEKYIKLADSYERVQSNFKLLAFIGLPIYTVMLGFISIGIQRFFGL